MEVFCCWHKYSISCSVNNNQFIPPAWKYNPSAWGQRIPLAVIGFVGFCVAMYLAFYQLHIVDSVWDPFFGESTEKVLTSGVSKKFPIPDALLGAFGYVLDVVTGLIGGTDRWKTKPWIVIVFGMAVGPLGLVSIFLVIAQPVLVGYWCTLCLCSAVISVVMISPAMDELLASLQYLQRVKSRNFSVWKAFWGNKEIESKVI
jgi:uncharacterized membrane protein